jgi:hypothetical protein
VAIGENSENGELCKYSQSTLNLKRIRHFRHQKVVKDDDTPTNQESTEYSSIINPMNTIHYYQIQ